MSFNIRTLVVIWTVILLSVFLSSCQNKPKQESEISVRFFIDTEQTQKPEGFSETWDSYPPWTPTILNQMKQDLGRIWFLVDVPKNEIDTVLEFQSFNLIELEAYSIDDGQNILPLQSLKHPLGHHHGFLVPGHLKKQKLLLMTDQEIGGFFLGFQQYSIEQFEQIKLYRSLMVGLVIGLFLLSLLMTLLVRGNPNQPWLLAIIISGVIGLFLEKRIYTFLNFEIDSMTYMKTFMFQLSISTIAYLRIISFETNLIKKQPYFLIERSLEIIITILFISGMILSLRMDGISLIQDTSIPFQLIVIGFIVSYLFCCFLLIQSWNKKPHLNEFSIAFILVYSLVIFTNFSVRGILPEDFNLWDGNYRAVIPLILALILYKDREVKMRNMANLLSLQDKNKDLFLARTSHELRTPLSGMIGLCENMLEKAEGLTPSFIRKLKLVVQNGWRMNQLISDLTDFSKMREGQLKVECRPEDFGEILDRVKENLKPEMERKQLTWKININPELPMIHADSDRIQQVLMNLIGNAIKYTEHGSILLEASASKSFVEVNIQDNGMGIPEEELRLVLEDYQRGTNVATTPGTGLGLNLSRHIIELHGGELSIESEVGKGTTVGFTLPVSEHNTSQIPSPSSTTSLSEEDLQETPGQIESDLPIPEKAKVLVVDDEPVNLEIIEDFLEELPLEITCYSSGDEFLNHLDEDEPDLLILDLMMPNMDGYAVIRQIRSEYSAQELPILVVTANEQERFSHQSLSLGANDYLIKPLEGRELRMRVRSQLSLTRQHRLQESVELLEKQKLALKRDQGRMKNLLDGVDLSLAVTDSKGKILQINRAFERLSGYAPDEIMNKEISRLFVPAFHPPEEMYQGSQTLQHKNGALKTYPLSCKPLVGANPEEWIYSISEEKGASEEEMPDAFETLNQELEPIDSIDSLRNQLASLLQLSVKFYRLSTGETQNEFAQKSGCWHLTLNGSTHRAYMLERYMDPKRVPKNPNWALVLKTCNWVVEECPESHPMKSEILRLKNHIEQSIFLQ